MQKRLLLLLFAVTISLKSTLGGILQARSSETREVVSLDGLWRFTTNASFADNIDDADDLDINLMPVPSSYNDLSTRISLRDHVGAVWYQRKFYVSSAWIDNKVFIRFGSVCYNASVFINGHLMITHEIGHLPFFAEITSAVEFGKENTIKVEVNNILTQSTIPQGEVKTVVSGKVKQTYTFDFFNYAGIDRPVVLFTTSKTAHLDDVTINTLVNGTSGLVTYDISVFSNVVAIKQQVNILDKQGNVVAASTTQEKVETLTVENANLWWPYLMDPNPGYMYTLEVLITYDDELVDHYKQPFGIRQLYYDNDTFTINGKNIYIAGFGRHEDSDIRGKGLDLPLMIRDYNLIKWIGANCYRTSHYPYAEEIMDMADKLGIMVIDEAPAVNTENFNTELLVNHKRSITEMYNRDKNRPSVVIWSIANDPRTEEAESENYYRNVAAHIKSLDTSRPITIANVYSLNKEHAGQFLDIIGVNRYQAWDTHVGEVDCIYQYMSSELKKWRKLHNKPVLMTEYGADSVNGLSFLPSYIWSEEYQLDVMEQYFRTFDDLRKEGWLIGEMIWHFADFKTDQNILKVGGNRKGMFTRNRQPKAAAFLLRKRYWALAEKLNNATLPNDLDKYVID